MSSDSSTGDKSSGESRVPAVSLSVLGVRGEGSEQLELADGTHRKPRGARRGDIISDRYQVEGTIGRGGMGRVMSVRHQVLGKSFALKLIRNRMAGDERIREMFYREGRLMSGLSHENICSIVDFGEDPTFGLFMVMELLDGQSLKAKLLHDGRFAPKVACDIALQMANALRYIHRRGIIHGDIKSDNILLLRTRDRHKRSIKLLDFGLARAAKGEKSEHVEGTPEYLAPERIEGATATQRSDIYALGMLFYELLVGSLPFKGTMEQLFEAHLKKEMPRPSAALGQRIDERADEIIMRATAKVPKERHEDVGAFIYELRTFMDMMGMGRRTTEHSITSVARRATGDVSAAAEVFELAPLPLASVNADGVIVVGNRAFREFLGLPSLSSATELVSTSLADVYPTLQTDLDRALGGAHVKRVITLNEGGGSEIEVAIVLSAPPIEDLHASGEVHIAVHPLARRRRSPADEKTRNDDVASDS